MRKWPRVLSLLPLALLALIFVAVVWSLARGPAPGPGAKLFVMPDGSRLTVEGITYGREHHFIHGNWWQKLALPLLPTDLKRGLQRRFVCRDVRFPSRDGETLVLWLRLRKEARTSPWDTFIVALDEHGRESEVAGWSYRDYLFYPPVDLLNSHQLPSFPRRAKTVRLRIYGCDWRKRGLQRLGECNIPNPARGPYAVWTPERLPITRRQGDLAYTLTELTTGLKQRDVLHAVRSSWFRAYVPALARASQQTWTRAVFRVTRNGLPAPEWKPVDVSTLDATGNQWTPRRIAPVAEEDQSSLYFGGMLWSEEPAWRLRVEFIRTSGFTPDELWTVRDVPVPAPGGRALLPEKAVRQGVTIHLQRVMGPYSFRRQLPEWMRFRARVEAQLVPQSDALRLMLLRATDERGRLLRVRFDGSYAGRYDFGLLGPVAPKRLNLTFALQKSRFIEFVVKPSLP